MIKYIDGNVFDTKNDIIAHGCNCIGGYGAGIAKTVATLYPKAKIAYYKKYHSSEKWNLGDTQIVKVSSDRYIANCATQYDYGSPKNGKIYVSYDGFKKSMEELKRKANLLNASIAMPLIGAGLAGGDWKILEGILNEVFHDVEIEVWIYKK